MAKDESGIRRVADAYLTLVEAKRQSQAGAEFEAAAARWRDARPKPPLSSEGERMRILAESAFRERDAAAAAEYYEAALDSDPTWPNGNFNVALLLAERQDFGGAAHYMRRYLLLVPDSPDAKVAREKLIVWEEKSGHDG